MHIRKTKIGELDSVMEIYASAREFMKKNGNPNQWKDTEPRREKIQAAIEKGYSHVCELEGQLLAVFTYIYGEDDPTYGYIEGDGWINEKPYGVLHSVASAARGKGAGAFCLDWALKESGNVRIDTHADNKAMQGLLKKLGYTYCGVIYLEDGDPRFAYQKCANE